MSDLGKRLKEERERLGLTQAKFADACGVGRTSQFSYEREEREPSWSYLSAAERIGADVLYILSGVRGGSNSSVGNAYSKLIYTIEMLLGLQEGNLEVLAKKAVNLQARMTERSDTVCYSDWIEEVLAWLGTSRKPDTCIDAAMLSGLLDSVELASTKLGVSLSTEKRMRIALMLYRDAKPYKNPRYPGHNFGGEIQQVDIERAVKLAAV